MSFEIIDSVLPTGVKPLGDDGVFSVRSLTDPQTWYRCDVTTFTCNCPRAEKGISAQIKKQRGYLPFDYFCKHLIRAVAYDQMLLRMGRQMEVAES
jgi:hypothetical protein